MTEFNADHRLFSLVLVLAPWVLDTSLLRLLQLCVPLKTFNFMQQQRTTTNQSHYIQTCSVSIRLCLYFKL